jgi:uncharacterized membrane protein
VVTSKELPVAPPHGPRAASEPQPSSDDPQAPAEPIGATPGLASRQVKRTVWSGILAGFGLAAFLDESIFHQILHWHHFYDKSTVAVGLVSDGLFHAFGFTSIVVGLFLMADSLRRGGFIPKRWWGALLLGAGSFQLYDGTVQHMLLRLHQIRYGVTIWPYNLTWNLLAAIMITVGIVLMRGQAGVARSGIFRSGPARAAD